jgi:hypothetical protein
MTGARREWCLHALVIGSASPGALPGCRRPATSAPSIGSRPIVGEVSSAENRSSAVGDHRLATATCYGAATGRRRHAPATAAPLRYGGAATGHTLCRGGVAATRRYALRAAAPLRDTHSAVGGPPPGGGRRCGITGGHRRYALRGRCARPLRGWPAARVARRRGTHTPRPREHHRGHPPRTAAMAPRRGGRGARRTRRHTLSGCDLGNRAVDAAGHTLADGGLGKTRRGGRGGTHTLRL